MEEELNSLRIGQARGEGAPGQGADHDTPVATVAARAEVAAEVAAEGTATTRGTSPAAGAVVRTANQHPEAGLDLCHAQGVVLPLEMEPSPIKTIELPHVPLPIISF